MSLGVGAYKVGGAGQCSNMRRRYPWQPCELPPPVNGLLVGVNFNSVFFLLESIFWDLNGVGVVNEE